MPTLISQATWATGERFVAHLIRGEAKELVYERIFVYKRLWQRGPWSRTGGRAVHVGRSRVLILFVADVGKLFAVGRSFYHSSVILLLPDSCFYHREICSICQSTNPKLAFTLAQHHLQCKVYICTPPTGESFQWLAAQFVHKTPCTHPMESSRKI